MSINRGQVVRTVAGAALLEMRRRKDPTVLGMLACLQLALLVIARLLGFDSPAAGTFLLNLSLTFAVSGSLLMVLVNTARQIPDELERRTLYPLLSRPVHRGDVLIGKWAACLLSGGMVFAVLAVPALLLVPRLEAYDGGTLRQLILLHGLALSMTAALALLCSLLLPRLAGLLLAGALTFGTGALLTFSRRFLLFFALPDPGRLALVQRYTDGIGPLVMTEAALLMGYGILWTALLLVTAVHVFKQRGL